MSDPMGKLLQQVAMTPVEWPDGFPEDSLYATHEGFLEFLGYRFKCHQLNNGKRVLDAEDVQRFFEEQP